MKMKAKNWGAGVPMNENNLVEVSFSRIPKGGDSELRKVDTITFTRHQWSMFRSVMDHFFDELAWERID